MTEGHKELMKKIKDTIDDYLEQTGVLKKLEMVTRFVEATDKAFDLIYRDPHSWSTRPCSTCQTVSELLGRPFGCNRRANEARDK